MIKIFLFDLSTVFVAIFNKKACKNAIICANGSMIKRIINSRIVFRVIYRFMTSLKPKRLIGVGLILSLSLTNGLALSLLSTKTAYAAPNYQINYQGKLADSSGTAVADGSYSIVFNLYTASSGGTAIWTESHTGANKVSVTSGLFSTMLGSITSLSSVDFNQTLYLGVTVESDSEMTPRKILGAVPAAFQARSEEHTSELQSQR